VGIGQEVWQVEEIKGEGFGEWIILKKLSKKLARPYSG
jgi:hypothetical protein